MYVESILEFGKSLCVHLKLNKACSWYGDVHVHIHLLIVHVLL